MNCYQCQKVNQNKQCEAYIELIGLEKECPGFTTDPNWRIKLDIAVGAYADATDQNYEYQYLNKRVLRKHFTLDELNEMYKLHKKHNYTYEEIAQHFNTTKSIVYNRIKRKLKEAKYAGF